MECEFVCSVTYIAKGKMLVSAIVQCFTICDFFFFKTTEYFCEVEALMEKMKQLQECRDEVEASQEEKATRFEKEKRESMLVCGSGWSIFQASMS